MTAVPDREGASANPDRARLDALHETGLLTSGPSHLLDAITRRAARLLNAPYAMLTLIDEDRQLFKSISGLESVLGRTRETPLDGSICRHVVIADGPLVIPDARKDERFRAIPFVAGGPVVAYAGVPVRAANGLVLGSVCVLDVQPREWSAPELEALETLGEWCSSSVALEHERQQRRLLEEEMRHDLIQRIETETQLRYEIAERERLEAELRQQSVQDELTGLCNRRGFFAVAEQQFRQAARNNQCVVLFYADMNDFKSINDTFGHREGDTALRDVARIMRESLRASDVLGRVGGDEFAGVILHDCPSAPAVVMARIRHRLDEANAAPGRRYPLSMSMGVASFAHDSTLPLAERLAIADSALYAEKRRRQDADLRFPDLPS